MTSQVSQNKALVERFNKEFVEGRQTRAYEELVSPDFINHAAPPGKQGFQDTLLFFQHVLWPALPGIKVEILEQLGEADKVVSHKILHATLEEDFMGIKATKGPVELKVIDIFRVAGGKLAEHWGMVDLHDVDGQKG